MTLFSAVLFIHVLSAMALFIGLAFEGAILLRLRADNSLEELGKAVNASRRLGSVYGPAFLGILVGGIYLAYQLHLRAAWVPLALLSTLLMGMVAGVVTGRQMSRLRKAFSQKESSLGSLSAMARVNPLVVSYGFRFGLAVGIVYLMSAMPKLVPSLVALVLGPIVGIVLARRLCQASPQRTEQSAMAARE